MLYRNTVTVVAASGDLLDCNCETQTQYVNIVCHIIDFSYVMYSRSRSAGNADKTDALICSSRQHWIPLEMALD